MAVFSDLTSCHILTSRFFQTLNPGGKMLWPKSMDRFCRLQLMATFEEPARAIIEFSTMSRIWPADWWAGWKLPSALWRSCQIDSKWPTWYLHKVMLLYLYIFISFKIDRLCVWVTSEARLAELWFNHNFQPTWLQLCLINNIQPNQCQIKKMSAAGRSVLYLACKSSLHIVFCSNSLWYCIYCT